MDARSALHPGLTGVPVRVVVFDDALSDEGVREMIRHLLVQAGYEVLGLFWDPHLFDQFLLSKAVGDVDIIGTVHTYPYDGQRLSVKHEPGNPTLGDRYLRTLFPISAPVTVRGINVNVRVAIAGTDAIDDPLVAIMDQFDAVWGEGRNPSGPFTFFHAEDFQLSNLRWYRGGDRPMLIRVDRDEAEPLRKLKMRLRAFGWARKLIDRNYYSIPKWIRERWGGDLTQLEARNPETGDTIGRVLRRQTTIVKDWVKIFDTLRLVPEVDSRRVFYNPSLEFEVVPPKILVGDDNPEHLRAINLQGLEGYQITVRQTAAELVRQLLQNDRKRQSNPALMFKYVLIDMEMPARVVRGELRPRKRRDRIAAPYYHPVGLVIAACARKLGYRVGILTFGEHHGSPVMSLLGNAGTVRNYELVGSRGIMVVSAQFSCTLPGDVRLVADGRFHRTRTRYRRVEIIEPDYQVTAPDERTLRARHPGKQLARLFCRETKQRVGVVLADQTKRLKWWGAVVELLQKNPDPESPHARPADGDGEE